MALGWAITTKLVQKIIPSMYPTWCKNYKKKPLENTECSKPDMFNTSAEVRKSSKQ